ncbi:helix-turn-helix domain-containing protein [Chitinophaga jiangningensis]|uniref:helix-turn-helix domain-containing protein n=1 Tax=Chitinophaga jiangningensis TaxID=1419482 RepID=UPI0009348D84|nr:helix-turn-helix domain-containing protein [Chitinophaga jiangningensis]
MKHFKTLTEFHEFRQLPKPLHPLISVVDVSAVPQIDDETPVAMVLDFYSISIKRMKNVRVKYGQHPFDFNEGILSFIAPNQIFSVALTDKAEPVERTGWVINIHPDFLWNTSLAKTIKTYDFWDYSINEALFLSPKEESIINQIVQNIVQECEANIDKFSKHIIISQIESLLGYSDRFYHRQFITREKANHQLLDRLDKLVTDYFNSNNLVHKGLPTVAYLAEELNLSPKYLTTLVKMLTGQNTQQFIHEKLIAKAKEMLTTTEMSVSEIAYELGFEHLQSFSKLFKMKNNISPLEFRQSFNL